MAELACPQCGALVVFRTADLVMRVCDYCRTAILRDGETLRAAGKVAVVPEDVSPLQLGTRGRLGERAFELVGRVRWRWSDGAWNEWLALYSDGGHGWLGEAMGRFMLLDEVQAPRTKVVQRIAGGREVVVGQEATIAGVAYRVSDIKQAVCVASEGELPSRVVSGTTVTSVDLMTTDVRCASVQREGQETHVYAGRYVSLADIAASNLRAFDGWPLPRYAA